MTADTLTVDRSDSIADVARRLVDQGISNAPVVRREAHGEVLTGFISERDLLDILANGPLHEHGAMKAADAMRKHPVFVDPDTSLESLASMFTRLGYRHVPVVGAGRVLLGMVSRRDVLAACLGGDGKGA